jgi:hypothetical protein
MKIRYIIGLFIFFLRSVIIADYSSNNRLHSNCRGLHPVYDNHGNLKGHRGMCKIEKWDGLNPSMDALHPVDPDLVNLHYDDSITHQINHDSSSCEPRSNWPSEVFGSSLLNHHNAAVHFEQPQNLSLFDWLSPHHDIIRNNPHYRHAHFHHHHCIDKTRSGLFSFLESLFGGNSYDRQKSVDDPYKSIRNSDHCLDPSFYASNPFNSHEHEYEYDPYSVNLAHRIHHLHGQLKNSDLSAHEQLRNELHDNYEKLHRHLDCHCHHDLPDSEVYNIHHHPLEHHSISMLAHLDPRKDDQLPLHLHSTVPLDPSMDMENEHMAVLRMASHASQHAYNLGHFNDDSDTQALRMQMFHPVNNYSIDMGREHELDDPEWNHLKVEKVIVIKRIKIPIIKKIRVPVPVPVPYPMPSSDSNPSGVADQAESKFANAKTGYMGNNTYMIDTNEASPIKMNSLVNAISGAPCGCTNARNSLGDFNSSQDIFDSHQNSSLISNPYQLISHPKTYNSMMQTQATMNPYPYMDPYSQSPYNQPNPMVVANTMMQPGLQLSPYLKQYKNDGMDNFNNDFWHSSHHLRNYGNSDREFIDKLKISDVTSGHVDRQKAQFPQVFSANQVAKTSTKLLN